MLDFAAARRGEITLPALTAGLTRDDLGRLTDEMIDTMLAIISAAQDADVRFTPRDPDATHHGADADDREAGWSLAQVIAHATAAAEEAAAHAATLARGVEVTGRSRFEVPWETLRTVDDLRARLEESRRMRRALLAAWPDRPHLEMTYTHVPRIGPLNAVAQFALGLLHDDWHLDQLRDVVRQARAARP